MSIHRVKRISIYVKTCVRVSKFLYYRMTGVTLLRIAEKILCHMYIHQPSHLLTIIVIYIIFTHIDIYNIYQIPTSVIYPHHSCILVRDFAYFSCVYSVTVIMWMYRKAKFPLRYCTKHWSTKCVIGILKQKLNTC